MGANCNILWTSQCRWWWKMFLPSIVRLQRAEPQGLLSGVYPIIVHFGRRHHGCKLMVWKPSRELTPVQPLKLLVPGRFFPPNLFSNESCQWQLYSLGRQLSGDSKNRFEWLHLFLEILRKCWADTVRKVHVLQMSQSKNHKIASKIPKYFSKIWPYILGKSIPLQN